MIFTVDSILIVDNYWTNFLSDIVKK